MNSEPFIPMVDTHAWHKSIQKELEKAAVRVIGSGRYVLGEEVAAFEQEAALYLGVKEAVSCANGTDALILALTAGGIGSGDEVITTPFTFFATAEAIARVGAMPVFVDIEPETFNIDPERIKWAITEKTKAVLAVHLFGLPARIQEIKLLCDENQLLLIEDCAQSFGASVNGQQTGAFGDFGCFSFFPSKNLGGFGDGGMVTTHSSELAERLRILRNHGSRQQYYHDELGFNSRLDELQAALLRIKLRYIEQYNAQRKQIADWYQKGLEESEILLPFGQQHVFHQYTVRVDERDQLKEYLAGHKVASAVYYPVPLDKQRAFSENPGRHDLFISEQTSRCCLSLPIFPGMKERQVKRVISLVRGYLSESTYGTNYLFSEVLS